MMESMVKRLQSYDYVYAKDIMTLTLLCGGLAREAGWDKAPVHVPTSLMLIVSELSEAMEGHRKNLPDDKLPQYPMVAVELADALIRILHLANRLDLPFGKIVVEKLKFNAVRPDHKPEAREAEGGKKY